MPRIAAQDWAIAGPWLKSGTLNIEHLRGIHIRLSLQLVSEHGAGKF